jgi:hypothetical protein
VLLLSKQNGEASISAVLNFRKALAFIQKRYPFSFAFGPAYSREACIESSQAVYGRLMLGTPSEAVLPFETIALLALTETSEIHQQKAKDLVKLFRPDRQGYLTVLDFVKSVDSVYKEFRLLSASIENSSRIDKAFETLFNIPFYALVATMILIQLDFDPLALFLSLSSVILAFAFMIGSASAKYFEGLLFILVRRPYGIGDRIHVSNVEMDTNFTGSAGWVSHACSSRHIFWRWHDELYSNLCPAFVCLGCRKCNAIRDDCYLGTNEREMQFVERLHGQQSHHQRCALSASPVLDLSQNTHRHALRKDSYFQDCNRRVFESASQRMALSKWLSCPFNSRRQGLHRVCARCAASREMAKCWAVA